MRFWAEENSIKTIVEVMVDDKSVELIQQATSSKFLLDTELGEMDSGLHTIKFNSRTENAGVEEEIGADRAFWFLRWIKVIAESVDSSMASTLSIQPGPTSKPKPVRQLKKAITETEKKRYEFFRQLLKVCSGQTSIFRNVRPVGYQHSISAGAGKSGLAWSFTVMSKIATVSLFLCSPIAEVNRSRFDALIKQKQEIERRFGETLFWDFEPDRKQNYIKSTCGIGGLADERKWSIVHDDMVERLVRLEKALRLAIGSLA